FNVDANQVEFLQRLNGIAALGSIVGVEVAGGPRYVDALPPDQHSGAAHQVDGADDRAAFAVDLREWSHGWRLALTPEPALCRRSFAGGDSILIDWMVAENIAAALHQVDKQVVARPLRQVAGDRLVGNVVRRLSLGILGQHARWSISKDQAI